MIPADLEGRSVGQLLRDLTDDVTRLIRDELALARSEASDLGWRRSQHLLSAARLVGLTDDSADAMRRVFQNRTERWNGNVSGSDEQNSHPGRSRIRPPRQWHFAAGGAGKRRIRSPRRPQGKGSIRARREFRRHVLSGLHHPVVRINRRRIHANDAHQQHRHAPLGRSPKPHPKVAPVHCGRMLRILQCQSDRNQ